VRLCARMLAVAATLLGAAGCGPRPAEPQPVDPAPSGVTTPAIPAGHGAPWTASLGAGGGLRLRYRGVDLLSLTYPFHGAEWAWANPTVSEGPAADGRAHFTIDVPGLHSRIDAVAEPAEPGVLAVRYTMHVTQSLAGVMGGGPELVLLPDPLRGRPGYADPELLPDGAGLRWAVGDGEVVTVHFNPPLPRVFFEQGRREQIRAHLLGPDTPVGTHTVTMRIELPEGGVVEPSLAERYAAGKEPWFPATFDWDATPIDLRRLNDGHRPAGVHGRIEVRGDRLVFADGTPARLWGTNVVAYSLFHADRDTIAAQARRIAALGFNLVRIHHHDSHWVEPNVFVAGARDTQALSDDALAKLDWWVECLQAEGVYVWLDLHVGRHLREGDDVPAFEELAIHNGELKGFNYVNPRIEALMQDFARRYLGRTNRYSGRRYADDPGLVGVLVTNENDVTHHFGNLMNEGAGAPRHRELMIALVEPFARTHGLPLDAALQPWAHGPAKLAMSELEARFHLRMRERLRGLGLRAPVATTSFWGDDPMVSLPALTVGDVVDVHGYDGEGSLDVDPRIGANFIHRMAAGRVEGMPMTITEWNLLPPVRDRFVGPVWLAAVAALQGWEAPNALLLHLDPAAPARQSLRRHGPHRPRHGGADARRRAALPRGPRGARAPPLSRGARPRAPLRPRDGRPQERSHPHARRAEPPRDRAARPARARLGHPAARDTGGDRGIRSRPELPRRRCHRGGVRHRAAAPRAQRGRGHARHPQDPGRLWLDRRAPAPALQRVARHRHPQGHRGGERA
jgi:hypothetical protein